MTFAFEDWPPHLTDAQHAHLSTLATTYALAHGILYLPPPLPPTSSLTTTSTTTNTNATPAPSSAIHAPLSLLPAPFPRSAVQTVQRLQRLYNTLYARVALDTAFLDAVMGADDPNGAGAVDPFTGALWRAWKDLRADGVSEGLHLGIFRSDYLLHAPEDAVGADTPLTLKQVEFNTISSSFGALSQRVSGLHKYLLAATGYYGLSPYLTQENLPPNSAGSTVVEGLAAAHRAYGSDGAYILFVVQPNERNVFDQRWLEYELLEKHNIKVIRQTFDQLLSNAQVDPNTRTLTLHPSSSPSSSSSPSTIEIAVIYYRAGYTPTDYPTPAHYALRGTLSRSRAINCPTLALQLAGGKKVQQVLTKPGVLERFLKPNSKSESGLGSDLGVGAGVGAEEVITQEDVDALRATWVSMWGLEDTFTSTTSSNSSDSNGVARAYANANKLVLKPQREGGGNNVYKDAIRGFLDTLPERERAAWVAMALIEPPRGVGGYLVRANANANSSTGTGTGAGGGGSGNPQRADVVSELGVFGWALFGDREENGGSASGEVGGVDTEQGSGGFLVRTKGRESDEGGVAVGFSVLDSVLLV